jgi:MOB kinase activator 1
MKALFGGRSKATFKPVKSHRNKKRSELSTMMKATLGTGNMLSTVATPTGESLNEWLAVNTVDFFNEVSLLFGLVAAEASELFSSKGQGFPAGFEYRWADGVTIKKPIRCSSPEYVDYVMSWVDGQINNEQIFPPSEDVPFPDKFFNYIRDIFKRLFRAFAIIYSQEPLFSIFESIEAAPHLNTSFKHFMYFVLEHKLVSETEMKAIDNITAPYIEQFAQLSSGASKQ